MKRFAVFCLLLAGGGLTVCGSAHAQGSTAGAPVIAAPDAANAAPAGGLEAIPSPDGLTMPKLDFTATPQDEADFDKYFYFHRAGTSFAEAYADIRECDALASGSSIYLGGNAASAGAMAQYGVLPAALGSAIGSLMADAIFGSAARRQQRRANMRNCMAFKEYKRFGLSHDLWAEFNFEEGMGRKKEGVRNEALALQALIASGPAPATKELGL